MNGGSAAHYTTLVKRSVCPGADDAASVLCGYHRNHGAPSRGIGPKEHSYETLVPHNPCYDGKRISLMRTFSRDACYDGLFSRHLFLSDGASYPKSPERCSVFAIRVFSHIGNYIVHPVALSAFSTSAVGWGIKSPSQELQNTNSVSLR